MLQAFMKFIFNINTANSFYVNIRVLHFLKVLSSNCISSVFLSVQRFLKTFILISGASVAMETINKLWTGYIDFCERSRNLFPRRAVKSFLGKRSTSDVSLL